MTDEEEGGSNIVGLILMAVLAPACRDAHPDGHLPLAGISRRRGWGKDLRQPLRPGRRPGEVVPGLPGNADGCEPLDGASLHRQSPDRSRLHEFLQHPSAYRRAGGPAEKHAAALSQEWKSGPLKFNRTQLQLTLKAHGTDVKGVPVTIAGEKVFNGFSERIGREIARTVEDCIADACPDPATATRTQTLWVAEDNVRDIPLLGKIDLPNLSLSVTAVMVAGMDSFNPCAFFVLLSLMVTQDRGQECSSRATYLSSSRASFTSYLHYPLAVIVGLFSLTLGKWKLTEWQGRVFTLVSGTMMLTLGLILVIRLSLMNNVFCSFTILLGSIALAAVVAWFWGKSTKGN